jgi:spore maturation protein CgeB
MQTASPLDQDCKIQGRTILGLGFAKWWGSDARALAQAFRRMGHSLLEMDEEDYISWRPQGFMPKAIRRLSGRFWVDDYNEAVLKQASSSIYDFVLVFKGNLLKTNTLQKLRETGKPIFNFYPDTNFVDYGNRIPAALPFYDCVFTTKSFHGEREISKYGIRTLRQVRHGFDPEVHRPKLLSIEQLAHYGCDVSFVGNWSPENEDRIFYVLRNREQLRVKVYGLGWSRSSRAFKERLGDNLKPGAFGDELSIIYTASKINLGLLRRATVERDIADQVTARTFQIPASRAFLLHEDTPEVRTLFDEGVEILLFDNNEDLVNKIDFALKDSSFRENMIERAYERCLREPYDYSPSALTILNYFEHAA